MWNTGYGDDVSPWCIFQVQYITQNTTWEVHWCKQETTLRHTVSFWVVSLASSLTYASTSMLICNPLISLFDITNSLLTQTGIFSLEFQDIYVLVNLIHFLYLNIWHQKIIFYTRMQFCMCSCMLLWVHICTGAYVCVWLCVWMVGTNFGCLSLGDNHFAYWYRASYWPGTPPHR